MTRDEVQAWLERYVRAWKSYAADEIGDLFAEDAEYRYHPWDDPIRGRAAIVSSWLEPDGDASSRDQAGTYGASYRAYVVDGHQAVAVGVSEYLGPDGSIERRYHNAFLLVFDGDGRCIRFTELFMLEPLG